MITLRIWFRLKQEVIEVEILDNVVIEELNCTEEMEVQLIDLFKSKHVLWNHNLDVYTNGGK